MADRIELARRFMELQREGKIDEAVEMLADDVVSENPIQGTVIGKAAVESNMRNRPGGGTGGGVQWTDPQLSDADTVTSVGTGLPFGPVQVSLTFNAEDKITRIGVGMA